MKIVFFAFSDNSGGACKAAFSIFANINKKIDKSYICIEKKNKASIKIVNTIHTYYLHILRLLEKIIIFFYKNNFHQSLNLFPSGSLKKIKKINYDILNLHWINRSSLSIFEILKTNKKLVISLHDMWFFNGSVHYSNSSTKKNLLENYILKLKKKIYEKKNCYYVAHSEWMMQKLINKFGFKKKKIFLNKFYPINFKIFKPRNKIGLRKKHNLPLQKKIILFSSSDIKDERKGIKYFIKIANYFKNDANFYFVTLGNSKNINLSIKNKNYSHIEFLSHNKSAEIYSLSDFYVCTSIIDNLPLTILESMSSGLPVITFDNGGSKEAVMDNGYIVKNRDYQAIIKILSNLKTKQVQRLSKKSRMFALNNFNPSKIANNYIKIFQNINKN